ncbi:hypothetical protein FWK35_00006296 [Aphis craccivora]|uniref:Uncharacterized protein n=1 Tax=Aphis craccivora TaxID=307492 RepID=A0A6G0YQS7_APHCR|nr:hypothetical protein FWK35_00006296 [Aphis craccivora]
MYSYNFLITIRITYEELCIKFSIKTIQKIDMVENWFCIKIPVFPLFFFLVFPCAFENYWEFQK